MTANRLIGMATTAFLVTACGSANVDDLREFTEQAHADRKPQVETLPEFRPHAGFVYSAAELTDPFSPANLRPAKTSARAGTGGRAPNPNRRKEALEAYPLDSLRMVGTLARAEKTWVIVRAPDGSVHHARKGNYVGQNYGVITGISDEKVAIKELIQGPGGDWIERNAALSIAD